MAIEHTPRLGLTQWTDPELLDPIHPDQFNADAAALDDLVAVAVQGTAAERPAFGVRGRLYYATDTGELTYDTGSAWVSADKTIAAVLDIDDTETRTALDNTYARFRVYSPEEFGAVGDGVADDTIAVLAAFDAANAKARAGLTATIFHPGASVVLTGRYNLASLSAPVNVRCNIMESRAELIIPASYAGIAVLVGHGVSGSYLQNAAISLPDIAKPAGTPIVTGSIGVRIQNIGNSAITLSRVNYFETGIHLTGDGQGTAYNTIDIGWISYCKVAVALRPHTASGWVNQNTFIGGGVQQSLTITGGSPRATGWRHVVLDGSAGNYVNGNTFIGVGFEGDASEFWLEAKSAANNLFIATRHETGSLGKATTAAASDTLTSTAHGLAVGDLVTFSATSNPGGMPSGAGVPYYVVAVPDADTFKVSLKKGGTAVTFTSAGSGLKFFRPPRVKFDQTGIILADNVIDRPFTPQGVMEVINVTAGGSDNVALTPGRYLADTFAPDDIPLFRARNRSAASGLIRAVFAAYAAGINPVEDPLGWSAALADAGVVWASGGTELGRLINSGGALTYKRPADAVGFEIPSARRSPQLIPITDLPLAASTTTTTTFTLTGASTFDHVLVTPASFDLPAGVAIAWARVSAADTIKVAFLNTTTSVINLTVSLQAMITRRFF